MFTPCRYYACQQHTEYDSVSRPLRIRHNPDAASCVSVFARMPVHLSGLVSEGQPTFRLYAARIASRLARGVAPLNPGKPKGRESGEARQARSHRRCRRARVPRETRSPPLQCWSAWHEHVGEYPPNLPWHPSAENIEKNGGCVNLPAWAQTSINLRDGLMRLLVNGSFS